jgi:sensor histidine kinase YesM
MSFLLVFMGVFCVFMTGILIKMVNAITTPVIRLFELVKSISEQGKGTKLTLSYNPTSHELN